MTEAPERPYLAPSGPLQPADAAVALIVDEQGRYLVQLRDPIPTIFFPDHWGCFGGALEPGESYERGLARELAEELRLDISGLPVAPFTEFTFDFGFAGGGIVHRSFFEVRIRAADVADLTLGEGREMRLIAGPDLLQKQRVPYDRFAIWMHCYRAVLARGAPVSTGQ
jgi:8-oxo-dGTP pyrophosphatase MutT (NUDIX family)